MMLVFQIFTAPNVDGEDSSARFSLMKMKCSFEHFLHFIDFLRCPCILITEST